MRAGLALKTGRHLDRFRALPIILQKTGQRILLALLCLTILKQPLVVVKPQQKGEEIKRELITVNIFPKITCLYSGFRNPAKNIDPLFLLV